MKHHITKKQNNQNKNKIRLINLIKIAIQLFFLNHE